MSFTGDKTEPLYPNIVRLSVKIRKTTRYCINSLLHHNIWDEGQSLLICRPASTTSRKIFQSRLYKMTYENQMGSKNASIASPHPRINLGLKTTASLKSANPFFHPGL
tara:strand:+ start:180 stop:503 length:324 start_codon:yes stop_codon:yes gene_type:complete